MTSPTRIRLDAAVTQIVDHCVDVCEQDRADGGLLAELTQVVKGERARRRPTPPYLWVVVGGLDVVQARALHETWTAAVLLSAFVASDQPEDGWLDAIVLAARARSVVIRDRNLDLAFIEDTQSAGVQPIGQLHSGRRFGAFARLDVRFSIVEPTEESP